MPTSFSQPRRRKKENLPLWATAIAERRRKFGYLQSDIEEHSGFVVKQGTVSDMENGKYPPTSMTSERLTAYLKALQWTPQQFSEATGIDLPGFFVPVAPVSITLPRRTPADRLKKLREDKGLTLEQVADQTGGVLTARKLANLEDRPELWRKVSEDVVTNLAKVYGVSVINFLDSVNGTPYPNKPNIYTDEVTLETHDVNQSRRRIPVYDLVSAGPGSDGGTVVSYIDLEPDLVGQHQAYRISGDSLSPEIEDGDVVVIQVREYASPGNTIVCWTPEEGMLVKRLDRLDDGYYVLTSVNPAYRPIWTREIRIYGIVVEIRKRRKIINGNHS